MADVLNCNSLCFVFLIELLASVCQREGLWSIALPTRIYMLNVITNYIYFFDINILCFEIIGSIYIESHRNRARKHPKK